ncbi:MAG: transcriptional regulator [Lentisphaerae bacterium]|nr:transcriptional regulator [Lentisphaerota bacterium]
MRLVSLLMILAGVLAAGELVVGEAPPPVRLEGAGGGPIGGGSWSEADLAGRVRVLFYVDPDEKDLNEATAEAIRHEAFPSEHFGSVAVINLEASRVPNLILNRIIAGKQKKFPRTLYVKDSAKALVRSWGLSDHGYDVVLFDAGGRVKAHLRGRLSEADTAALVAMIRAEVERLAAAPRD